jgi:hypothetical protein
MTLANMVILLLVVVVMVPVLPICRFCPVSWVAFPQMKWRCFLPRLTKRQIRRHWYRYHADVDPMLQGHSVLP